MPSFRVMLRSYRSLLPAIRFCIRRVWSDGSPGLINSCIFLPIISEAEYPSISASLLLTNVVVKSSPIAHIPSLAVSTIRRYFSSLSLRESSPLFQLHRSSGGVLLPGQRAARMRQQAFIFCPERCLGPTAFLVVVQCLEGIRKIPGHLLEQRDNLVVEESGIRRKERQHGSPPGSAERKYRKGFVTLFSAMPQTTVRIVGQPQYCCRSPRTPGVYAIPVDPQPSGIPFPEMVTSSKNPSMCPYELPA